MHLSSRWKSHCSRRSLARHVRFCTAWLSTRSRSVKAKLETISFKPGSQQAEDLIKVWWCLRVQASQGRLQAAVCFQSSGFRTWLTMVAPCLLKHSNQYAPASRQWCTDTCACEICTTRKVCTHCTSTCRTCSRMMSGSKRSTLEASTLTRCPKATGLKNC